MINWKVRIKNKAFWIAFIPAVLMLINAILGIFGYSISFDALSDSLLAVVNCVFVILTLLGIVNDPTTAGLSDSEQAMTYEEPKED